MKKLFFFTASTVSLVLAASCATMATTKVWDETFPPEQSATVWFYQITVKSYNGINVDNWSSVVIPAGEVNIGGNVRITHAGVPFMASGMEFTCHLEAEKEYALTGATRDGLWGVNLYEGKKPGDKSLVFIPFKDQPVFW
jgi:hypothetical protein